MRDTLVLAASKTSGPWTTHDTRLIIAAVAGIALVVLLIAAFSVHPFLALVAGSALTGFAAGVGSADIISNFEDGVGSTLMEVGLLIALGAMLGKLLAESGGADKVVDTLVDRSGPRLLPWTIGLVAVIVALPMFFEIGLVLMLPVIVLVTKKSGLPLMRVAIPALAGLSALHGLIPPHPGPLIAIGFLHAQLGITLAFGIVVAIPTVIICGPLFSIVAARWVPVEGPESAGGVDTSRAASGDVARPPSFGVTLATILFPVVLMLAKALADIVWDSDMTQPVRVVLDFVGEPLVALFLAVVLASVTFGYAVGFDSRQISDRIGASLPPIAGILLIVGAGGGFKQTLIGAGVGDTIGKAANDSGVSILVIAWLLAAAIRLATGSATVATTTAAGIIAPLVAHGQSDSHLALIALAVGTGSLIFSHVNDAGFWLVNQSFKLTVGQTFKTWSVMETLLSVVGFGFVSLLWVVV
ncbi:gluconate:H+ symporter [Jatrophihabitans endophyticus]|uniref:GntT/GntP/DsdX family permease n=1 Tax=Jatrophihabitans endophyticus TaxID=1206085 RepID=UPI0019E616D5|nr:gluconate:H+ symporter [Jatrophihabitans endophyticus]MBE7186886.1 gluconate transporter [Jatrophihabitans endophyticus]